MRAPCYVWALATVFAICLSTVSFVFALVEDDWKGFGKVVEWFWTWGVVVLLSVGGFTGVVVAVRSYGGD